MCRRLFGKIEHTTLCMGVQERAEGVGLRGWWVSVGVVSSCMLVDGGNQYIHAVWRLRAIRD